MAEERVPRSTMRSFVALLAGFFAVVILSLGTDSALAAVHIFPPLGHSMADRLFAVGIAYRVVYGVLGGYITARLAPNRPMLHSLLGGAVGLIINIAVTIATWDRTPALGPHWYPLALIVITMPCAWLGGRFGSRHGSVTPPRKG